MTMYQKTMNQMTMNRKPASIFRRIYNNVLEARAREANRHINRTLKMMGDDGLNARSFNTMGLNRD